MIGPSGSGKSTLLRCLNLLGIPTEEGYPVPRAVHTAKDMKIDKYREKFGMVFQLFNLFENLACWTT